MIYDDIVQCHGISVTLVWFHNTNASNQHARRKHGDVLSVDVS